MKKLNVNITIKNLKGDEIKVGDETMTIGQVIANSLSASKVSDPTKNATKQYHLALKVYGAKEIIEVEESEFDLIKEVMGRNELQYTTLIIGQIFELFEDAEK